MNWSMLQTWCQVSLVVFAVLAALAGFLSNHFGKKAATNNEKKLHSKIDDLLEGNKNLQQQLEPFIQSASQKYPGIALDEALEKLKEDLEKIKAKVSPRTLNQEQRETLIEALRLQERKKFSVIAVQGDQEAFDLAQSLKMTIQEAGYNVDDIALVANIPFRGLHISVGTEPAPECANLIYEVLTDAGFMVKCSYESQQDPNIVSLFIGSKSQ